VSGSLQYRGPDTQAIVLQVQLTNLFLEATLLNALKRWPSSTNTKCVKARPVFIDEVRYFTCMLREVFEAVQWVVEASAATFSVWFWFSSAPEISECAPVRAKGKQPKAHSQLVC
jgi:hypothetical protein